MGSMENENNKRRSRVTCEVARRKNKNKKHWLRTVKLFHSRQRRMLHRKRLLKRRNNRPNSNNCNLVTNEYTKNNIFLTEDDSLRIILPRNLDFDENFESTTSFFNHIRSAVFKKQKIGCIAFDNIRDISPAAALVLAAEIDQWKKQQSRPGERIRANVASWDENIKRLLCQMGYFDLLKMTRPESELHEKNTVFFPFKRGCVNGVDDGGSIARELRIDVERKIGNSINRHCLFEGISEAITNVGQHAYPIKYFLKDKNWWLSASYNFVSTKLHVIFYDQGVGIPKTLPTSEFYEDFKEFFSQWTDSQKIKAAMELGRSATGRGERGKGLQNLVAFARAHREGQLSIYSLRGMFKQKFSYDGLGHQEEQELKDSKTSIGGTLIEWSVTLAI